MDPNQIPGDVEREARERLREAVRGIPVDPRLHHKVRGVVDRDRRQFWVQMQCAVAGIALGLTLVAVFGLVHRRGELTLAASPQRFHIALGDHLECALHLGKSRVPREAIDMGPELLSTVERSLGAASRIVDVHRCEYMGNSLIHMVARSESGMISVILRQRPTGSEIVQARADAYSVSTVRDEIYVVSTRDAATDRAAMKALLSGLAEINWEALAVRRLPETAAVFEGIRVQDLPAAR